MKESQRKPGSDTEIDLVRFIFVLPEPISLPDDWDVGVRVRNPNCDPAVDDPLTWLIFRQVQVASGRSDGIMEAISEATKRMRPPIRKLHATTGANIGATFTVVEATTVKQSPDQIPAEDLDNPRRWLPRADALARSIYLSRTVVQAYRQATEAPIGLPSYVRIPSPVLVMIAKGRQVTEYFDGNPHLLLHASTDWSEPKVVLLDHANLPDPVDGRVFDDGTLHRLRHWFVEGERRHPMSIARERFIEARRAHEVMGDEGQAVVLANTGSEVLIDTLLAILMWDEGLSSEQAAPSFLEGKLRRRLTEVGQRLKFAHTVPKDLASDLGPVGEWFRSTYSVRHRVVHAGYSPPPGEARAAIDAAFGLQKFLIDQVANSRNDRKRVALMVVGENGLEKRGLWSGRLRRFAAEYFASAESDRQKFTDYYTAIVEAGLRVD